jgi:hypothetical protein
MLASFFDDPGKRNGIPSAVVHPCPLDVKACVFKKNANGLACEFIAVLGMNGFTFGEMKIKLRGFDAYFLVARALEVHLDA